MFREEPRPPAALIHPQSVTRTGAAPVEAVTPVALPFPDFGINEARALFDGDAYDEMIGLVARAQRSVRLEFFLFGGPVADSIIDLLAVKKAEGVHVRVTLDRTQGFLPQIRRECRKAYRHLLAAGIDAV